VSAIDRLAASAYLSLTTFRRVGTPVATPVWLAQQDDHLYVITGAGSGKVKRLRHTSRVLLAPCDARGRLKGPQVEGTARLLDADETVMVRGLIDHRYGLLATGMSLLTRLRNRGRSSEEIGIEITVPDEHR
jgi:PPOX class probable F420-dependent enzyme